MRKALVLAICLSLGACVDTDVRPAAAPPPTALFDPAASPPVVPTPTDLARDPTTGKIAIPLPPDASQAARDLAAYLASLDAYPPSSPAHAMFSAPVDAASVTTANVLVLDLTAMAPITGFTVHLDENGQRLVVVPPNGAWPAGHAIAIAVHDLTSGGSAVLASPAFFFARSANPITASTGVLTDTQAAQLEMLRLALAPVVNAVVATGVPRESISLAWEFTVSSQSFAAYDPEAQVVPFPNDILRDPTTGKVNLPVPAGASPAVAQLIADVNTLDGFSTTASVSATFDLAPNGPALGQPTPGAVVTNMPSPATAVLGDRLVLTPTTPLTEKTTYFVIVTDAIGVLPPPIMVLLRSAGSLVDASGKSAVFDLSDAEAAQLEPLRVAINQVIAAAGVAREHVVLAWTFTTESTVSALQALIANNPTPASTGMDAPIPNNVPVMHLAAVRTGTIVASNGMTIPYLLTLAATPNGKLVIYQHGAGTDETSIFAIADSLAVAGFATVAIDLPTDTIDLTDLLATRDRLMRAAANLEQLARTASGPGLGGIVFPGEPAFVGVSTGAIVGADFAAIHPGVQPVVLSTAGATLVDVVLTSPLLAPSVMNELAQAHIAPGSIQEAQFVDFARWILDPADPVNYGTLLVGRPVLVQIGGADQLMVPDTGARLAASTGAASRTFAGSGSGALVNPMDPNIAAVQTNAVGFLAGGAP